MFGDGLEKEVIIRVLPRAEQKAPSIFSAGGATEYDFDRLDVWANAGLQKNFERIPGVEVNYIIYVDPRYNLKWVVGEIEAIAKTEQPIKKKQEEKDKFSFSNYIGGIDLGSIAVGPDPKPKPHRKPAKRTPKPKK